MRIFLLLLLLFVACTNQPKPQQIKNPSIVLAYQFNEHPDWQNAIMKANLRQKFDLIFVNTDINDNEKIKQAVVKNHAVAVISDLNLSSDIIGNKHLLQINPEKIKQAIVRASIKTLTNGQQNQQAIVINSRTQDIKALCAQENDWLLALTAEASLEFLKQMPRDCKVQNIWSYNDLSKDKENAYLKPVLKQVKTIAITDIQIMNKCLQQISLN